MTELTDGARHHSPVLTRSALAILAAHDWPGNVRELRHVLERAVTAAEGDVIDADDLADVAPSPARIAAGEAADRPTLEELERRYVAFVLRETKDNQSRAAAVLGISRKALWEKRKRYGID